MVFDLSPLLFFHILPAQQTTFLHLQTKVDVQSIALAKDGKWLITETSNNNLLVVEVDGSIYLEIISYQSKNFQNPQGIAIRKSTGHIFVSEGVANEIVRECLSRWANDDCFFFR